LLSTVKIRAGGTIGKLKGNQLVRTRGAYLARELAVLFEVSTSASGLSGALVSWV